METLLTNAVPYSACMSTVLQYLLVGIIIAAVLVAVPNVANAWKGLQLRMRVWIGDKNWGKITEAVEFAIRAAEQAGLAAKAKGLLLDKKAYAIQAVKAYLALRGLNNIDVDLIAAIIEDAVRRAFPKGQLSQATSLQSLVRVNNVSTQNASAQ